MEYTVSDFYDCLYDMDLEPKHVKKVLYAWGLGDSLQEDWEGGFCFEDWDGNFSMLLRENGNVRIVDDLDKDDCVPPVYVGDEYIETPTDINTWLEDDAPLDTLHTY